MRPHPNLRYEDSIQRDLGYLPRGLVGFLLEPLPMSGPGGQVGVDDAAHRARATVVPRYDWSAVASTYEDIYRSLPS